MAYSIYCRKAGGKEDVYMDGFDSFDEAYRYAEEEFGDGDADHWIDADGVEYEVWVDEDQYEEDDEDDDPEIDPDDPWCGTGMRQSDFI